jgi:hypothetical protein
VCTTAGRGAAFGAAAADVLCVAGTDAGTGATAGGVLADADTAGVGRAGADVGTIVAAGAALFVALVGAGALVAGSGTPPSTAGRGVGEALVLAAARWSALGRSAVRLIPTATAAHPATATVAADDDRTRPHDM